MSVEFEPEDIFRFDPDSARSSRAHEFVARSDEWLYNKSRPSGRKSIDYLDTTFASLLPQPGELIELSELPNRLGQLALHVHEVDLAHLRFGLAGYKKVTEEVQKELSTGFFSHPEKMKHNMPEFANTFMRPLMYHVLGLRWAVNTWNPSFYSSEARLWGPAEGMANFMPRHIKSVTDLPETSYVTNTQSEHKHDYTVRINTILRRVAEDNFDHYAVMRTPMNKVSKSMAIKTIVNEFSAGRDDAWSQFEALKRAETQDEFNAVRLKLMNRRSRNLADSWTGRVAIRVFTDPAPGWVKPDGTPTIPDALAT